MKIFNPVYKIIISIVIILLLSNCNSQNIKTSSPPKIDKSYISNSKYIGESLKSRYPFSPILEKSKYYSGSSIYDSGWLDSIHSAVIVYSSEENENFLVNININSRRAKKPNGNITDYRLYNVPYSLITDSKLEFSNPKFTYSLINEQSKNKTKIDVLKHDIKNAKNITAKLIEKLIDNKPKYDSFMSKSDISIKQKKYIKSLKGIYKVTFTTENYSYNPEEKGWNIMYATVKNIHKDLGKSIGSNAFGVTATYKILKDDYWRVMVYRFLSHSPEDAKNIQTITVYGRIKDLKSDYDHQEPTIRGASDWTKTYKDIILEPILTLITLKNKTSEYILPTSYR